MRVKKDKKLQKQTEIIGGCGQLIGIQITTTYLLEALKIH